MSYLTGNTYNFKRVGYDWFCKNCNIKAREFKEGKRTYLQCTKDGDLSRSIEQVYAEENFKVLTTED